MEIRNSHGIEFKENRQRKICLFTDWISSFLAFLGFDIFRFYYLRLGDEFQELLNYILSGKLILEQIFVPILLLFIYWLSGYYNHPFERSRLKEFLVTLYSQVFNAVIIYLAALTNDQLYLRRENWMLLLILFLFLFTFTYLSRLWVTDNMFRKVKKYNRGPRTVIIGTSQEAFDLATKLTTANTNKPNEEIIGFLPFGNERENALLDNFPGNSIMFKDIEELKKLCAKKMVDQVVIVPPNVKSSSNKILSILYNLFPYDIAIKINPDIISIITPTIRLEDILGEPFIDLSRPQTSEFSKNIKRTFDVIASILGLSLLSPILAFAAIGVRLSGPGRIIYSQERIGIHRKPFKIYKFRSMIEEAEEDGMPRLSSDSDHRITRIGKWLRKYRIDELPQFWNVLKGEMSLVGPRPEREYFIDRIIKKAPWYTLVLQVRPGITSWGMVKYGYATDVEQMIERNRYDLIYLTNMSTAVDFKILIHTIKTVGKGEGK